MSADTTLELTAQIVSAHARKHKSTPEELAALIAAVHAALIEARDGHIESDRPEPAVPISDAG